MFTESFTTFDNHLVYLVKLSIFPGLPRWGSILKCIGHYFLFNYAFCPSKINVNICPKLRPLLHHVFMMMFVLTEMCVLTSHFTI